MPLKLTKKGENGAGANSILESQKLPLSQRWSTPTQNSYHDPDLLTKRHTGESACWTSGHRTCRLRVKYSVWWPGVTKQTTELIQQCPVRAKEATSRKEPLMISPLDYFSRYPVIAKLTSTTSLAILKSIFARHGIPEITRNDNGPQYTSQDFLQFS